MEQKLKNHGKKFGSDAVLDNKYLMIKKKLLNKKKSTP